MTRSTSLLKRRSSHKADNLVQTCNINTSADTTSMLEKLEQHFKVEDNEHNRDISRIIGSLNYCIKHKGVNRNELYMKLYNTLDYR